VAPIHYNPTSPLGVGGLEQILFHPSLFPLLFSSFLLMFLFSEFTLYHGLIVPSLYLHVCHIICAYLRCFVCIRATNPHNIAVLVICHVCVGSMGLRCFPRSCTLAMTECFICRPIWRCRCISRKIQRFSHRGAVLPIDIFASAGIQPGLSSTRHHVCRLLG